MPAVKNSPLISYHGGHSAEFCDHAAEDSTTEGIVRAYLAKQFTHFAITEHRPPHDEQFVYPDELEKRHSAAFLQNRFDRYFADVRPRIIELVGQQAHIAVGFETEYYGADPIGQTKKLVDRHNPDLIVLSVHHVDNIPIDFDLDSYRRALKHCGSLDALYQRYFDHQYDLISNVKSFMGDRPVIIGHFDLIKIFSSQASESEAHFEFSEYSSGLREKVERNIAAAIENGFVFEVNARAFKKGLSEPYPGRHILEFIKTKNGEITLGDDSHGPDQVGLFYDRSLPIVRESFNCVIAFERQVSGALKKVTLPL